MSKLMQHSNGSYTCCTLNVRLAVSTIRLFDLVFKFLYLFLVVEIDFVQVESIHLMC